MDSALRNRRRHPQVSVVVVTHNEGEHLRRTVETILATTPPRTELLIVDDQSTDGSADFIAELDGQVQLLRSSARLGISRARNLGARASTGEVIVFSDAHVNPRPGWAEPLYLAAQKPFVGEVGPAVGLLNAERMMGFGFTWREPSLKMHWLNKHGDEPYPVPFLCGCFVAMRREVVEEAGGFDEGLVTWGSEDAEMSLRLWRMGYECQVVPRSRIGHLFRKRFPYQVSWEGIIHNTLRLAAVHLSEPALGRVLDHYRTYPAFPPAFATLAGSDVWNRRETLERLPLGGAQRVITRFGIDAFD